jgi:pyruvate,water dikinase
MESMMSETLRWLDELGLSDLPEVGGKNASLGELLRHLAPLGVAVPGGFATTARAYRHFLAADGLDRRIADRLAGLDVDDVAALAQAGAEIRHWIEQAPLPATLETELRQAYGELGRRLGEPDPAVAVRSSATAEDLPDASFAGQQETFLNVRGAEAVIAKVKAVFASLYNDRAIAYRVHHGFTHEHVALSAGIQQMVRSDLGAAGVLFTLDTESGFRDVVFITSSYGLGELVVQGAVNPDEFYVYKPALAAGRPAIVRRTLGAKQQRLVYGTAPGERVRIEAVPEVERRRFSLSDAELHELARQAVLIERHYGRPMDVEWGKDGNSGKLYILQARPETVKSRQGRTQEKYVLHERAEPLVEGRAIGARIGRGRARVLSSVAEMHKVEAGDVLIADMTDPDWEPIMKRASAIARGASPMAVRSPCPAPRAIPATSTRGSWPSSGSPRT